MTRWLLAVALAFCGGAQAQPAVDQLPLEIMAMPPELQALFEQRVLHVKTSHKDRLQRMVGFVLDPRGMGMRYEDGATNTVAESWATRRANCLGFTLVFLALAREAGLEAWPQVYEQTLSWHRADGILYRSSHVNAAVRIGARTFTLDAARGDVITRGQAVRLTPRELLARYHNNLAVETMKDSDLAASRRHMETALDLNPAIASHWSNAGVLELREGHYDAARSAYEKALALDPENTNALFNMVNMARREGQHEREAEFRARLAIAQQKDPFHHFLQAIDYELAGDYANAIANYRLTIRLHGGDHRFHAALAGALEKSGDDAGARKALARAIALSEGAARDGYRERLRQLQAH